MPDVEDSSPLVHPSLLGCCKAMTIRTILHGVMVTALFSVIMFAYIFLHCVLASDVQSLVIQIITYLALGNIYIYNSSCRQDKFSSAGYLVLVMSVFLFAFQGNIDSNFIEPISWANMVAISSYCLWRLSFVLPYCRPKKLVRTILHSATVTMLLVVITSTYGLYRCNPPYPDQFPDPMDLYDSTKVWLLIQLVAYNAVAFLYICNSSGRKEKIISCGFLVLVLLAFLLSSSDHIEIRTDVIFGANITSICTYCISKLHPRIRRWLDALDAHTETEPRQPARQQEAVLNLQPQQTPFHIQDKPKEFSSDEIQSITQDFGNRPGLEGRVVFDLPSEAHRPSSSAVNSSEPRWISEQGAVDTHGMYNRATESEIQELEKKLLHPSAQPTSLPLWFLKSITHDFCKEQELGSGGYGVVYKGTLRRGSVIAVKKFHDRHLVHDDQFQNEASFLMGIEHQNLVQLLGFCAESRAVAMTKEPDGKCILVEQLTRMLCFEYVCNQGLDKHLSDESSGLEWKTRYEIIKGICSGLNFLHEREIVHLDLKPQNILLDATMMPKIVDFGLSRLLGSDKSYTIAITSNRVGTIGYMAPEYISKGEISKKADIFSLGVIIIEILKGCKDGYPDYHQNNETDFQHFTEEVLNNWRNRFERAPMYTALELHTRQVKQCIDIALRCVQPDKRKRPNISNIIEILNAAE